MPGFFPVKTYQCWHPSAPGVTLLALAFGFPLPTLNFSCAKVGVLRREDARGTHHPLHEFGAWLVKSRLRLSVYVETKHNAPTRR